MKTHSIFPTLIIEKHNDNNEEFKDVFFKYLFDYIKKSGYSHERTGDVIFHKIPEYENIFKYINDGIKDYIKSLNADPDIFDINFVKSWLNVLKDTNGPIHNHMDAHLSFSYYINVPDELVFSIFFRNRELGDNWNDVNNAILRVNVMEANEFNSEIYNIIPEEGDLLVFPSKLMHGVMKLDDEIKHKEDPFYEIEDLKTMRVCIAGDILLTYKDLQPLPLGLQPIKNWKTFTN